MSRMSLDTAIRLSAEVKGGGNIDRVKRSLQDLGKSGQTSRMDMVRLEVATKNYARANDQTIAGIRNSLNAFRGLQEQARIGSAQFKRYGDEITRLEAKLKGLDGAAQRAGSGLRDQVISGLGAIGAGRVAGGAIRATVANEESERRLRSLSQGLDEFARVQLAADAAAAKFGITQTQANQEFAQIYARLRPIGLTLEEVSTAYNGFNTAAKLSGTTSAEASAAFLQLSQALGTGVLRGEELNSVFEQTPGVVQAIAQVMGVPIGQIRDLAKEGQITSDIVLTALGKIEREGAPKLAEAMKGPAQQFRQLGIEGDRLQRELGEALLPATLALTKGLTAMLQESNKLPEPIKRVGAAAAAAGLAVGSMTLAISAIGGISAATTALKAYTASAGAAATASTTAATAATGLGAASGTAATRAGMLLSTLSRLGKIGLIVIGVKFAIEGLDELITGLVGVRDAESSARAMAERRGLTYTPSAAVQRRNAAASDYVSPFAGARDRAFALAQQIQPGQPRPGAGGAVALPVAPAGGGAAGGGGGGGRAAAAVAESMGAQIAKALQQALNLTPAQSAGIVGNLMRESGLNPRVNEGGAVGMPRGIGGYGLAQWTGSRQTDLVSFAGGGAAAGNLQTQLRFIVHELLGPESRALASLRRTTTPEEAAVVFDRDYERSGIKALSERKANARQVFGEIAGTGPGVGLDDFASTRRAEAQAKEELAQKQAEANKRLEEFIEARTKSITELNKETELLGATTEIDRRRLEYAFERNEIIDKAKQQETDLLAIQEELKQLGIDQSIDEMKARIETEKNHALLILQKREEQEINDLIAERVRMMQDVTAAAMSPSAYNPLEQQKADLDALLQKYPQVGAAAEAAADLATRGLTDMATGARSAKEVFADFLRGIADALVQTAKTMIAQYVAIGIARMFAGMGGGGGGFNPSAAGPFGGGGMSTGLSFTPGFPRAMGGPVNPGEIRPVGERGPELFVPYQAGTIIPAEATEAIAALNTAARGQLMVPYMGGGSGAAVGGQSGAAGLSVPFQGRGQQGGGSGLSVPFLKGADGMDGAAGGGGLNDPIRFESVLIGEVEYVTRSEAEEIGRRSEQRGAQRGAALAEKRARNNVSTRRSYR